MTLGEKRNLHLKKLNRAAKLGREGKHNEAEKIWRKYLESVPDDPAVLFNVGGCVQRRANTEVEMHEAGTFYESVVTCKHADPELKADAMNNLGLLMEKVGHSDKAMIAYGYATKMKPDHWAAKVNLGDSLRFFGKFYEADAEYKEVIKMRPDSAEAHFCAGMIALLIGDMERGWKEFAWRWQVGSFETKPLVTTRPRWKGEPLAGKTLMLWEEQGYGDSFQFIRYANVFKQQGARVIFGVQPCMRNVMSGVIGLDAAVVRDDTEHFDFHLPLMDAPMMAGTTLDNIPLAQVIRPMPHWPVWKMQCNPARKRVGLVWAGSPKHGKDRARSIQATMFQPLIDAHPEHDFYSLQCTAAGAQFANLRNVTNLAPQVTDWTDTAQMLMCMDVLVSVDTACVHLAGAAGTPVFMLCPHSPDWRWLLDRNDSPWYPKLRLFRQPAMGNWEAPLAAINEALCTI